MPQQHTTLDQVNFLGQWFSSWSEMKREDFLPILIQAFQPKDHINGLLGGIDSLRLQGRRPSLFDCQVKLFHDWFVSWEEGERERLLQHLREIDPDFMSQFDKRVSGGETESQREDTPSTQPECADESLNNPPSSVSSPPSTLPRSHSPHDSGLDEPASDCDHTEPHSLESSHDTEDTTAAVSVADGPVTPEVQSPVKPTTSENDTDIQEATTEKSEQIDNGSTEVDNSSTEDKVSAPSEGDAVV